MLSRPRAGLALECPECGTPVDVETSRAEAPPRCGGCAREFALVDGILQVRAASAASQDYPPELYALLVEAEDRHFWFGVRTEIVLSTMRGAGCRPGARVLDVGCGTGFLLRGLEAAGLVGCGIDMHLTGLRHARRRVEGLLCQDTATRLPFTAQFDWTLLCDVVEHADDDVALLGQARRATTADGRVLVTVPALPALWSAYDEAIGHKRRYTRATLVRAMRASGLVPTVVRYFNAVTVPIELLRRRLVMRRRASVDVEGAVRSTLRVPPAPFNSLLRLAALTELRLFRLRVPFGSSLIAVGRHDGSPPGEGW